LDQGSGNDSGRNPSRRVDVHAFGGACGQSSGRTPVSTRDFTTGGCGEARSSNGTSSAESSGSYRSTAQLRPRARRRHPGRLIPPPSGHTTRRECFHPVTARLRRVRVQPARTRHWQIRLLPEPLQRPKRRAPVLLRRWWCDRAGLQNPAFNWREAPQTRRHTSGTQPIKSSDQPTPTSEIAGHQLSSNQQDMVNQIRQFMGQSKAAIDSGDLERARTLAWKAQVLSEELVKPEK